MFKFIPDINWRFIRPLVFVLVIGTGAVFASQALLSGLATSQNIPGCPALSDSGEPDSGETVAIFEDRIITPLHHLAANLSDEDRRVLGLSTEDKWIEVDLSDQTLIAHQGNTVFLTAKISSGLWNSTPVGEYRIWYKITSTKMEGGSRLNHTYYYLPNVPYAMFFYGDYGIHGTYWHNDFGRPRSHGCINTQTDIAEKLFYWAGPQLPGSKRSVRSSPDNPGTRVVIHQ